MRVAVFLHGSYKNDYRVLKTIKSLSSFAQVDLFCVTDNNDVIQYDENITIYTSVLEGTIGQKLLRHSTFCFEYNFLFNNALSTNNIYTHVWANDLPTLNAAYKLVKKQNAKLIYDSHEIFIETLNQFFPRYSKGMKKFIFSLLLKIMRIHGRITEKRLIKKIDVFVTVNESILDYFSNTYDIRNGHVLMNFPSKLDPPIIAINYRSLYNWSADDIVILYQGNLNEGRGLRILLETIVTMPFLYKLVLVGDGVLKKELKTYCTSHNLNDRVKFTGQVPLQALVSYTKGADIGVSLLEEFNLSKKMASPNKLFEYIQAGIPILSTNTFESKKIIESHDIGVLVKNDVQSISQGLISLSQKKENKKYIFNLKKIVDNYSWEIQDDVFKKIMV